VTGVTTVCTKLRFSEFEKDVKRLLLVPNTKTMLSTEKQGDILTVKNGKLVFSASPTYSDALYSMKYGENEWLYSKYPVHEPYAWWNPYIGGLQTRISDMQYSLILREDITARFVEKTDCMGNVWQGIRTTVSINKFDKHKGMKYSSYFLTLSGLPVMCHFALFENGTGTYRENDLYTGLNFCGKDGLSDYFVECKASDKQTYRRRMGEDTGQGFDRMVCIKREGENPWNECLYVFRDAKRDLGANELHADVNYAQLSLPTKLYVKDGGRFTTRPVFCLFTDKCLELEMFKDFDRITFE
jgi:hypothetical protein